MMQSRNSVDGRASERRETGELCGLLLAPRSNTATGSTLVANGLVVLDTVMTSSTRLYCHKGVMLNPQKKKRTHARPHARTPTPLAWF